FKQQQMDKVNRPKILFISTARTIGGGEVYLANILPLLKDRYDCTVMGTPPVLRLLKDSAETHRIALFPRWVEKLLKRNYRLKKLYYQRYFRRYLGKNHFDIINLQEFDGAFVESINFKPIILSEQTRLFIRPDLKPWAKALFEKIDTVICVSQQTLDDVTELGVARGKCVLVHNGVDTKKLQPA